MNSTEEETYKILKGLTVDEAMAKFTEVYCQMATELVVPIGGVPISLIRDKLDAELKPYGWSTDKLFGNILDEIS